MPVRSAIFTLLSLLVVGCPDEGPQGDDDTTAQGDDDTTASDDDTTPAGDDDSQGSPCGEEEYECGDDDTADGCWYAEYSGTTHVEIDLADGTNQSVDCPTTASLSKSCLSFVGTMECGGKAPSILTFSGDIDSYCGPLAGNLDGVGPIDCFWAGNVEEDSVQAEFQEVSAGYCVHGEMNLTAIE